MSSEYLTDGIPWCAIDRENGYLYTSQFHNVGEILQYDLETMTFLRAIPLKEKLDRIQGGSAIMACFISPMTRRTALRSR